MLYLLDSNNPDAPFPDVATAEQDPNGLLAVGGDLSPSRLINAYRHGIFPWYSEEQPILWWSPDPRTVLFPEQLKISRSLRKTLRKQIYRISFDQHFEQVLQACAAPRHDTDGTWITSSMEAAYVALHKQFAAHSIEVWHQDELVGGLYGVAIGQVFFGESMFSNMRDASKVGLVFLVERLKQYGYQLIDCQVYTEHLISLGAEEISRQQFINHLNHWCTQPVKEGAWHKHSRVEAIKMQDIT
ncbi:Leucyl/phenylalanyl-tRNA--protein transferase [hydrothermal vent metagenome]|uniref:Leucyl/phenylalanyl-tRNA--protein transferase n=1 Tax=hydrothermal vent metagenome TaxID=652676 RepID=A0A3B1C4L9_9ZZZZ